MTSAAPGKVAVTGATGFIGRTLIRRLLTAGVTVRALGRTPPDASWPSGIEWVRGDLSTAEPLLALASGTQALIHCAGAVRGATWEPFYQTNVVGTAHVVAAARATGSRLLYFSSLAAREPGLSFYARSKREAEQHVLAHGERATVLRPPAVYGEGDRELMPLLDLMWRGLAVVPHHEGHFSLIHVEDLVSATLAWLHTPHCPSGPFEIDDGHKGGYDWPEVIATVSRLSKRRLRTLKVPRTVLMVPATLNAFVGRIGFGKPMITPGKVNELYHTNWICCTGPFELATRWQPTIGLDEGLARLFAGHAS